MQYPPARLLTSREYGRMISKVALGDREKAESRVTELSRRRDYFFIAGAAEAADDRHLCEDLVDRETELQVLQRFDGDGPDEIEGRRIHEKRQMEAATDFALAGRRVVHFDAALTNEFMHTDLGDARPSDIQLPWDAFFMAFDRPESADGAPSTGYMIARHDPADEPRFEPETDVGPDDYEADMRPTITITPMSMPPIDWMQDGVERTDPASTPLESDEPLELALFGSIASKGPQGASKMLLANAEDKGEEDDDFGGLDLRLTPEQRKSRQNLLRRLAEERAEASRRIREDLALVGNALLFLSQETHLETRWQNGTPTKLVEKSATEGKTGDKATREIIYAGWSQVSYIGLPAHDVLPGGGSVRPHWRRGHWRRQRHGRGNAETKLIRIRPTVVAGTVHEANITAKVTIASAPATSHAQHT